MLDLATFVDRMPEPVRRFAYRVALGRGFVGRLADAARFRFSEDEIPVLPPPSAATIRLFIGPANSAGQAYRWARAAERFLPGVTAVSMHGSIVDPFLPDIDVRVPVPVYQRSDVWHFALEDFLAQQTHVMWESGLPLLGRRYDSDITQEVALLRERGVQGALLFHGSDIRPPSRHAAESRWSPFRDRSGPVRALEEEAAKNAALAAQSKLPVFVSTPDLVHWVPEAAWCPVVVDSAKWRAASPMRRSPGPPVVAHAPTLKWLKGTSLIEPMLHRLAEDGVISYRQIIGVPHASMPALYADSDIVLDQFQIGSYGVTACEAMASGRLVMGHVDDFTRDKVREQTGLDLPVHEATIETLEGELRYLASHPEAFDAARTSGPAFVDAVHNGRMAAAAMAPFLGFSA